MAGNIEKFTGNLGFGKSKSSPKPEMAEKKDALAIHAERVMDAKKVLDSLGVTGVLKKAAAFITQMRPGHDVTVETSYVVIKARDIDSEQVMPVGWVEFPSIEPRKPLVIYDARRDEMNFVTPTPGNIGWSAEPLVPDDQGLELLGEKLISGIEMQYSLSQ